MNPSHSTPAAKQLQRILDLLGHDDAAGTLIHAEALSAAYPHDPEALRLKGIALLRLQRPSDAFVALKSARSIAPDSVEIVSNSASAALASGDPHAAVAGLQP